MSALADFRQRCEDLSASTARSARTDRAIRDVLDVLDNNAEVLSNWLTHPNRHRLAAAQVVQKLLIQLRTIKQEDPR